MRSNEIRVTLLGLLKEALPYAMLEQQLLIALNARVQPPIGKLEFGEILIDLNEHEIIAPATGKFGDKNARWILTKAGELEMGR
jgi:hypothetical protein